MISFRLNGQRFQLRAAAVILHEGFVLLHRAEGDEFWALPGGRVEVGEDAATTIVREMNEELGETVRCAKLLYVVEHFFEYEGKQNHEIGLYFLTDLSPNSRILSKADSHPGVEGDMKLDFRWFPQVDLDKVDIRPRFLSRSLASAQPGIEHVVQRE